MPIFEFHCQPCDRTFELLILPGRRKKPACPACGGGDVRKLLSTFATGGGKSRTAASSSASSGGCASCAGGNCATCR